MLKPQDNGEVAYGRQSQIAQRLGRDVDAMLQLPACRKTEDKYRSYAILTFQEKEKKKILNGQGKNRNESSRPERACRQKVQHR